MRDPNLSVDCAAAMDQNRKVWSLPRPARHDAILRLMHENGVDVRHGGIEQGFLLSDGRFAERGPAHLIAKNAGQVGKLIGSVLTSEDLW